MKGVKAQGAKGARKASQECSLRSHCKSHSMRGTGYASQPGPV